MKKGQVGFDFILAILIALILIGGLGALTQTIEKQQARSAVRNQEKAIALEVYRIVSSAHSLKDGDNFELKYVTKMLTVPGLAPQKCVIKLATTPKTVSYTLDGELISMNIPEMSYAGIFFSDSEYDCGEQIIIT